MLFNSVAYLIFFPVVLSIYWLAPAKLRRLILLVASYYFYMSWLRIYGLLLFALTAANFAIGLWLSGSEQAKKTILVCGLAVNLGTLCFFKYTGFLLSSAFGCFSALAPDAAPGSMPALNIVLPLGISFFAFEFIHYLTDIYRGHKPITNPVDFALFAAFFPSQIAGPIKRYQDFMHQLAEPSRLASSDIERGVTLLVQGLFKKVALSDNLAPLVQAGFHHAATVGAADAWLSTLAFAWQIYFDFSGYTDMGRGSAILLGFSLPDNFNFPYLAANLSDFWKRWHISLSTWLRDYLYIPLGGARLGRARKHLNLITTMLLGGLWHGAAWHYVVWGAFHGAGLVVCHEYGELVKRSRTLTRFHASFTGMTASTALTFATVLVGWVFFRAETVRQAIELLGHHFQPAPSGQIIHLLWQSPLPAALTLYCLYILLSRRRLAGFEAGWQPALPGVTDKPCSRGQPCSTSATAPELTGIGLAASAARIWKSAVNSVWRNLPVRIAVYAGSFLAAIGFCPTHAEPFIYFQF